MAFTFGFYNAELKDGLPDRSYDAQDFGKYLDGIISDGVIKPYGDAFKVTVLDAAARKISIGTGKGWFNGTWNVLDEPLEVTLPPNVASHLEAVILQVNHQGRTNRIYTASFGNKITLSNNPEIGKYEYCLAGIRVADNAIVRANSHIGEGDPLTPWSVCLLAGGATAGGGSVTVNDSGAYTTGIQFVQNGFNLTFTNATGLQYVNEYSYIETGDKITEIRNKTLGKGITISYDG